MRISPAIHHGRDASIPLRIIHGLVTVAKAVVGLAFVLSLLLACLFLPTLWEGVGDETNAATAFPLIEPLYHIEMAGPRLFLQTRTEVIVRDSYTGALIERFPLMRSTFDIAPQTADHPQLLVCTDQGCLMLMELESFSEVFRSRRSHKHDVNALDISPNGQRAASGCSNFICLWDLGQRKRLARIPTGSKQVESLQFSADGSLLLVGYHEGSVQVLDASNLSVQQQFRVGYSRIVSARFFDQDQQIVVGSLTGFFVIWDRNKRDITWQSQDSQRLFQHILAMEVSPNKTVLAVSDSSKVVHLYSLESFEKITSLKGHSRTVTTLRFSPEGDCLYSGGHDGTVRTWDLASHAEAVCFQASLHPRE